MTSGLVLALKIKSAKHADRQKSVRAISVILNFTNRFFITDFWNILKKYCDVFVTGAINSNLQQLK